MSKKHVKNQETSALCIQVLCGFEEDPTKAFSNGFERSLLHLKDSSSFHVFKVFSPSNSQALACKAIMINNGKKRWALHFYKLKSLCCLNSIKCNAVFFYSITKPSIASLVVGFIVGWGIYFISAVTFYGPWRHEILITLQTLWYIFISMQFSAQKSANWQIESHLAMCQNPIFFKLNLISWIVIHKQNSEIEMVKPVYFDDKQSCNFINFFM